MKRLFSAILVYIFSLCLTFAQQIEVIGIENAENDLSARVYERKDGNDDPCALVKVVFPVDGAKFEGNIVGDVRYDTGVYWVYLTSGSKKMTIQHPQYLATTINFAKYANIKAVQTRKTYIVKIKASGSQKKQTLTISFSPSNASVIIDGKMYPSNNGQVTGQFPVGRHEVIIAAVGYESYEGTINLRETAPSNIQTTLIKSTPQNFGNEIPIIMQPIDDDEIMLIDTAVVDTAVVDSVIGDTVIVDSVVTDFTPITRSRAIFVNLTDNNAYSANSKYTLEKVTESESLYNNADYSTNFYCFQFATESKNTEERLRIDNCYLCCMGRYRNYEELYGNSKVIS